MLELSIVVPVYNVERFLPQCLASLRAQEGDVDYEIVCVNDGSTDLSGALLARYAAVEPRLRVVERENGGLASARNAGIEAALGAYVCFVDSDDWVDPDFTSVIAHAIAHTDADVVVFGAKVWPAEASYPWLDRALSPITCFWPEFSGAVLADPGLRPFAQRVAVRRELLVGAGESGGEGRLRFDEELRFGEDQAFLLELYPRAHGIASISAKPYHYRAARPGSLMEGRMADLTLRAHDHVRIVEHVLRDWRDQGFLDRWGRDIFYWAIDFVVPDILRLDEPDRSRVLTYAACTLRAFFDDETIAAYLEPRHPLRGFARAALTDRSKAAGVPRKLLYYRHTLVTEGLAPFVDGPWHKVLGSTPVLAASDFLAEHAPIVSPKAHRNQRALEAKAEAAAALADALDQLDAELREQGGVGLFGDGCSGDDLSDDGSFDDGCSDDGCSGGGLADDGSSDRGE